LQVDPQGILQVPGREWAVFRLGHPGLIGAIEVDTNHFRGVDAFQVLLLAPPPRVSSPFHLMLVHPGNFPDSCRIEACLLSPDEEARSIGSRWNPVKWEVLLPPQKVGFHHVCHHFLSFRRSFLTTVFLPPLQLRPHHRHHYSKSDLRLSFPVSHVRLVIAPDGGVSRLRLWGRPTPTAGAPANQKRPASKL